MDKLEENALRKAQRAIETVLNNELPLPSCPTEKEHVKKKREKVRQELANELSPVGPNQLK